MTNTPDEIKKGLECCTIPLCDECPYDNDPSCVVKNADALALIQQLQAENAEQAELIEYLKAEIEEYEESADKCCYESRCNAELNKLEALCKRLMDENEQLEAEREMIRQAFCSYVPSEYRCDCCKHSYLNNPALTVCPYYVARQCDGNSKWEWHGLPKEE